MLHPKLIYSIYIYIGGRLLNFFIDTNIIRRIHNINRFHFFPPQSPLMIPVGGIAVVILCIPKPSPHGLVSTWTGLMDYIYIKTIMRVYTHF